MFAPYLGSRSLSAVYGGDGKLLGSISATLVERVVATANPTIAGITDVKNDQGKQMRLRFRASPFDFPGSGTSIVRYDVFRRIDPSFSVFAAHPAAGPSSGASPSRSGSSTRTLVDGWDFAGTLSAYVDSAYILVVPTLADSNSLGIHRATFFVRAATGTASVFYDSAPDSGYSVDNLPPAVPAPFTGAYESGATHLHWGPNSEPDLWYYKVYRGSSSDFVPGPSNLIATRADTGYADVGSAGSYYKLSAVDVNGNESGYATLSPSQIAGVGDPGPVTFALEPIPNPSWVGRLRVTYSLPSSGRARLELLDVSGRRVADREVGSLGAGRHVVDLAERRQLPPGLYLVRLTQGANVRARRVVLLE